MLNEGHSFTEELSGPTGDAIRGYLRNAFDISIGVNEVALSITSPEVWLDGSTGCIQLDYSVRAAIYLPLELRYST